MNVRCRYDELMDTGELLKKIHPKNPNKHSESQLLRLAEILKYQGVRHPIVISKQTGLITKGHGRLGAAVKNRWEKFPVEYQDYVNADQEYADVVSDNAIASWAELDLSAINFDIPELGPDFDINMLGLKDFEIEPADKYADKDADEVPDSKETTIVLGDLFSLGKHRLLCGDSTDKSSVERLMNGEKADMVFTDPPYGISLIKDSRGKVGGGTKEYPTKTFKAIHADDDPFDPAFLLTLAEFQIIFGGNYFASKLPDSRCWFIWDKNHAVDRTFCGTELAWTNLDRHSKIFKSTWDGYTKEGESGSKVHPSQKPIKVCSDMIADSTEIGALVVDPFLGSGSTLIACEKIDRRCFGMEIDPQYCQTIIDRWEKFTGLKAEKIG